MSRELAEGWVYVHEYGLGAGPLGVWKPMYSPWYELSRAPPECFAEPAEPDPGAPELRVGKHYYCDTGGRVRHKGKVRLDQLYPDRGEARVWHEATADCWFVPLAALHREGPQSKPLHEDDVFLGRYPYGPDGALRDGWWADGKIRFEGSSHGVLPANIYPYPFSTYAAALAVARALGLVEAEKDEIVCDGCGAEGFDSQLGTNHVIYNDPADPPELCGHYIEVPKAEPERPEQKFQVRQWGITPSGVRFRIAEIVWSRYERGWVYRGDMANGSPWSANENNLEPCTPVLTASQESLRPGDVVENVEILVGSDGVPLVNPSRLTGSETIESVTFRLTRCHGATLTHGRVAWLWNLRLGA